MFRWTIPIGICILGLILTASQHSPSAPVLAEKPAAPDNVKRTWEVLNTPDRNFEEIQPDPKVTLLELLGRLSKDFSRPGDNPPFRLTFEINQRAFDAEGLNE